MSIGHTISAEFPHPPAESAASGIRRVRVASSPRRVWAGRILSGLAVLFLVFDVSLKLLHTQAAVQGTVELGYPEGTILTIGLIEALCLVVYLVPRTAVVGAILWTGYLGGAIATQLRVGNPLFSHEIFPLYIAAMLWGGLWLRDPRLRGIVAPAAHN